MQALSGPVLGVGQGRRVFPVPKRKGREVRCLAYEHKSQVLISFRMPQKKNTTLPPSRYLSGEAHKEITRVFWQCFENLSLGYHFQ